MNVSYIAHVSGKVQGVYFRASSQQVAIDYGLSGYAKNLEDGDVEILICGEEKDVDKMLAWLAYGPPEAEVVSMEKKQVKWQQHNFFAIS
ncbi:MULTISPECIES: acylphosphatase [unclassified Colwellia]|jgi:acylphosphatase|uniref:acylphosphatase n=1 Tax=unclassified Colwellia TaxID=196834 RepID=UPI0015F6D241|nr:MULTISPECIES: acylphosphatase [unclassified Colwellia]MBA6251272.1 acylphosphatase [Colwellia sp. MB3u-55]MBA6399076.1 acylphosphatase [Colwellia sp. BRX10-4]